METLGRRPEQDVRGILHELPDPCRVRSMTAYVIDLCKKFANGEDRSLKRSRELYESLKWIYSVVREIFYTTTEQSIITETSFDARAIYVLQIMRREEAGAPLGP